MTDSIISDPAHADIEAWERAALIREHAAGKGAAIVQWLGMAR